MQLFFNYSIDCETPSNTDYTGPERRPFFRGPATWDFAERSVRGFVERMDALGVRDGAISVRLSRRRAAAAIALQ